MRSNVMRLAMALAALAVAVVLFVALQGAADESSEPDSQAAETQEVQGGQRAQPRKPSKPAVPKVVVRDGEPVDGVAELTFKSGQRIKFRVSSDVADEVHVHGYDRPIWKGYSRSKLEHRAVPIAELQVHP